MKLHFGNLATSVTDAELKTLVSGIAEPATLEIVRDHSGTSKGFGFVEFSDDEKARAVIAGLDGKDIGGKTIKVAEARPRKSDAPRA